MSRSFSFVESKVAEAEYFLSQMHPERISSHTANFYLSAFASAARSITFTIQSSLSGLDGFEVWWEEKRQHLKEDPLAKYFLELRNFGEKRGTTVLNTMGFSDVSTSPETGFSPFHSYWLGSPEPDMPSPPSGDAYQLCREYFTTLLGVVYDCHLEYGGYIDPQLHYTPAHHAKIGKTIEDAEADLGYPRGWTGLGTEADWGDEHRFALLRRSAGYSAGSELFEHYIGRSLPTPEEPMWPETNQESGWNIPDNYTGDLPPGAKPPKT